MRVYRKYIKGQREGLQALSDQAHYHVALAQLV